MQHVAQHHGIKRLILQRKLRAVVMSIIDGRVSSVSQVNPDDACAQHRTEMMCDEAIAAPYIQHFRSRRYHARDLQSHVVCASNLAATALAHPTTLQAL